MKIIQLHIAGVLIQLNFHPTEGVFFYNKLITDIQSTYKLFIVEKLQKPDYYIDFYQYHNREIFSQRKGKTTKFFVDFCKIVSKKRVVSYYKIGLVQFQFIISNILQKYLEKNGGFMLHASGIIYNSKVLLFTGKPGSGKSTAMTLLSSKYSPIADDSIIVGKSNEQYICYQTPFIETNDWIKKELTPYPIHSIFFLRKSKEYKIIQIKDVDYIVNRLSKQIYISEDEFSTQIKNLLTFIKKTKFYFLSFGKNKNSLIRLLQDL